jgi:hypothetical protein
MSSYVQNIVEEISVTRFKSNPLITSKSSSSLGDNINGPSIIRVPEWVNNPLGKYYMYFAHHSGTYIRLAYADDIEGPWLIYEPGTLKLDDALAFKGHIASPDVHVDDQSKQIRMYFHGPTKEMVGQWTGIAFSDNGIDFIASTEILGKFYFRVWQWKDKWYALAKNNNEGWGELYQSDDGLTAFKSRGNFLKDARHAAVMIKGDYLLIFYSRVGDVPERILMCSVNMQLFWEEWVPSNAILVIEPEMDYEGSEYPLVHSGHGCAMNVRQLRDPCVFHEDGRLFLFYTVAGEAGIAGAKVFLDESIF